LLQLLLFLSTEINLVQLCKTGTPAYNTNRQSNGMRSDNVTRQLIAVVFVLIAHCQSPSAQKLVRFSLEPSLSYNIGYTEYIMNITGDMPTDSGVYPYVLRSKLEFPLDALTAGITAGMHSVSDTLFAWSVQASFRVNVEDPGGVMKDHDWETVRRLINGDTVYYWGQEEKWSYTESKADMKLRQFNVEGCFRIFYTPRLSLDFWGGFRYQRIEQDIVGYEGWGLWRDSSEAVVVRQYGTVPALYYRVTYTSPHIGLRSNLHLDRRLRLAVWAAFAPVWVSDLDDHLLRKKEATADITGSGFILGSQLRIQPVDYPGFSPLVSLHGDLVFLRASGNQTQRWYGDDPFTPDINDTGKSFSGIPHEINTLQLSIGVRVGLTF
jgi:hypothetical protein